MWKLVYQFASLKLFYIKTQTLIKYLPLLSGFLFFIGLMWGLFFAPADYQQGDAFRIIYIHVPCAFLSISLYSSMCLMAISLLVWRVKIAGIMLKSTAQTGALLTFLALITGSIWGKPMWGTWWIWDARLTSELILFMLYCATMAVHYGFNSKEKADRVVAILTLVGVVDLPIIHYSVYWWNTLHQGSTLSFFAKPKIDASMAGPLYVMILAFLSYVILTILIKARAEILVREVNQKWVREIL
jgi:heme exporter protein C